MTVPPQSSEPSRRPPLAEILDLRPHPEGGWFRETWRTSHQLTPPGYGGPRTTATGIYFLLSPGEESRPHVVRSDEVWLWHRGGPLTLVLGGHEGQPASALTLGPLVEEGQVPQALVPAGTWQAARPAGTEAVLVSCVVSPGFDFADFRMI
ncbi:cupin domain-containing protein [Planobispora longispora]|uniref:Cupin n=1 Tax=Planobispora longispora TaxID=28887 RepID=A0A8J3RQS2_9ACTN|nr:cupin domain-containing protein [Planobispora longispora]GIH79545.1 cupin [Planobispora longispora]